MLNFKQLFEMQEKLDNAVIEAHGLKGVNLTSKVISAFYVELAELAQEIGYFKYWKINKKTDNIKERHEEWSDTLHFALSIGIKFGHQDFVLSKLTESSMKIHIEYNERREVSFERLFDAIYKTNYSNQYEYSLMLGDLMTIGCKIGMDYEDMHQVYKEKNDINYERIANKY